MDDDRVPGDPVTSALRRELRRRQERWREREGLPIGSQPMRPKPGQAARPVGARIDLDHAVAGGANFLTPAARDAARARAATKEPQQTFDHQRFWADLLWSPSLAVNLFADDPERRLRELCPDAPGRLVEVRFSHSPGRLDPSYLNSLRAFDAAFFTDAGAVVGVAVHYHEWLKPEIARPENLTRYHEVADRSGCFAPGTLDWTPKRDALAVTWLEHLLLLSMLQHHSGRWTWGRYVVVHPAGHADVAAGVDRYRTFLTSTGDETFGSSPLEDLVAGRRELEERY